VRTVWDEAKRAANLRKHGVDFAAAATLDWSSATIRRDDRFDYGEVRYRGLGVIGTVLYAIAFTYRTGDVRVISLRKANAKEIRDYEKAHAS